MENHDPYLGCKHPLELLETLMGSVYHCVELESNPRRPELKPETIEAMEKVRSELRGIIGQLPGWPPATS